MLGVGGISQLFCLFSSFITMYKEVLKGVGVFIFFYATFFLSLLDIQALRSVANCEYVVENFFPSPEDPLKIPCLGESSSIRVVLGNLCFQHREA